MCVELEKIPRNLILIILYKNIKKKNFEWKRFDEK